MPLISDLVLDNQPRPAPAPAQPFSWFDNAKIGQARAGLLGPGYDASFSGVQKVMNPLTGVASQGGSSVDYKYGGTPETAYVGTVQDGGQVATGNVLNQQDGKVWIPPTYRHADTGAILVDMFTTSPEYLNRTKLGAQESYQQEYADGQYRAATADAGPQGYFASEADYTAARNAWYQKQGLPPTATILSRQTEIENPFGNGSKDQATLMYAYNPDTGGAAPIGGTNRYSPSGWVSSGRDMAKMVAIAVASYFTAGAAAEYFGAAAATTEGAGVAAGNGAFVGEGVSSGVGAWDAASAASAAQSASAVAAGNGAFLGEGTSSGVGAWDAAATNAGAPLAAATPAAYTPATNAALADSAAGTPGYGASSAGAGGGPGGGSFLSSLSDVLPSTAGGWADLFKSGYGLYSAFNQDKENAALREGSSNVGNAALASAADQAGRLKNETLPMLQARDKTSYDTGEGLIKSNLEDAGLARDRATQAWDQGAKDYEFQDRYRDLARKAQDGSYGDELAGVANADTAQAFDVAEAARQRNAQRLGVNPGSGAYLASMADAYNSRALAQAGAVTNARRFARDKAESMVATAAKGYGNQDTSAKQAGLATQSTSAAGTVNANQSTNTANYLGAANNATNTLNTTLGVAGSAFNRTPAPTPALVGAVSGAVDRFNGREPVKP